MTIHRSPMSIRLFFSTLTLAMLLVRSPLLRLLAEDGGTSNPTAGSYSLNAGTWSISATGSLDSGGYFVGQQYSGDFVVTAKLTSATSGEHGGRGFAPSCQRRPADRSGSPGGR